MPDGTTTRGLGFLVALICLIILPNIAQAQEPPIGETQSVMTTVIQDDFFTQRSTPIRSAAQKAQSRAKLFGGKLRGRTKTFGGKLRGRVKTFGTGLKGRIAGLRDRVKQYGTAFRINAKNRKISRQTVRASAAANRATARAVNARNASGRASLRSRLFGQRIPVVTAVGCGNPDCPVCNGSSMRLLAPEPDSAVIEIIVTPNGLIVPSPD